MKARLDQALNFHQRALNVQAHRQELLASNIANADTPNYKARDIDFRAALERAQGGGFAPLALTATAPGHIGGAAQGAAALEAHTGYRRELQSAVDGNTVNMDVERAAFAENSIHYEASVTFINGLLQGMQRAISGQ